MCLLEVLLDLNLFNVIVDNKVLVLVLVIKLVVLVVVVLVVGSIGFIIVGGKDEVFVKVGIVLEGVEGVIIVSCVQLLGLYDVVYEGSNFLVCVVVVDVGVYIFVVDLCGLLVIVEVLVKLIVVLKVKLVQ